MMNWKLLAAILPLCLAACDTGDSGDASESEEPGDASAVEETADTSDANAEPEAVEEWVAPPYVMGADIPDHIRAAVEHIDRPEADKARDGARRPGDVLAFADLQPGMTALDLVSTGGFYTELLSRAVGSEGKVITQNPPDVVTYYAKGIAERDAAGRLPNVEPYAADMNQIDLPENSIDLAVMGLNYHDIYYTPEPDSDFVWPPIDTALFLNNILSAVKPGGSLLIIDHEAGDDAADDVAQTLHRITSTQVIGELEAAGFVLARSGDMLLNPADDHSLNVFDPTIRGRTDRFILLFSKPE